MICVYLQTNCIEAVLELFVLLFAVNVGIND